MQHINLLKSAESDYYKSPRLHFAENQIKEMEHL
jgi:hypothetical protein